MAVDTMDPVMRQMLEDVQVGQQIDEILARRETQPYRERLGEKDPMLAMLADEGGETSSGAMVTSTAGFIDIYNRETGVSSRVTYDAVNFQVRKKKFPAGHRWAGQPVYQLQPMVPVTQGLLKCPLHEDSPERAEAVALGFGHIHCSKDNLVHELDVEKHMRIRHKSLWEKRELTRRLQREAAHDELLRQQTEAMIRMSGGPPVVTAAAPAVKPKRKPPSRTRTWSDAQRQAARERAIAQRSKQEQTDDE